MRRLTIIAALLLAALLVSLPASAQDVITTAIGGGPNGIPALDANLYNPLGVAVDAAGNFYIASYNQNRVFKVNGAGTITVVAGSGAPGYTGDGGAATCEPVPSLRGGGGSPARQRLHRGREQLRGAQGRPPPAPSPPSPESGIPAATAGTAGKEPPPSFTSRKGWP